MAQSNKGRSANADGTARDEKAERLAEALRANLRRRKAQSAARKDLSESDSGPDDAGAADRGQTKRNEET